MKHILTTTAAAICLMSSAAFAAPSVMTDEQMDTQVAGNTLVVNKAGKTVWTVTKLDLNDLQGFNNGGNGNTAKTAPGLLKAAGDPLGLGLPGNGMGLSVR